MTHLPPPLGQPILDAILMASAKPTLDEACRILQDLLHVTDGGYAGQIFSDLQDDSGCEEPNWQNLPVPERQSRLTEYVQMEIAAAAARRDNLELEGFTLYHSSGGVVALRKDIADGSYWLVSDGEDGSELPRLGADISVQYLDPEENILYKWTYRTGQFYPGLFLNLVAKFERDRRSPETDPLVEAQERDDFLRENDCRTTKEWAR